MHISRPRLFTSRAFTVSPGGRREGSPWRGRALAGGPPARRRQLYNRTIQTPKRRPNVTRDAPSDQPARCGAAHWRGRALWGYGGGGGAGSGGARGRRLTCACSGAGWGAGREAAAARGSPPALVCQEWHKESGQRRAHCAPALRTRRAPRPPRRPPPERGHAPRPLPARLALRFRMQRHLSVARFCRM